MFKDTTLKYVCLAFLTTVIAFPLISILWIHPNFSHLMIEHVEEEAINAARHLKPGMLAGSEAKLVVDSHSFQADVKKLLEDFDVMKVKVFSKTGEILFSTDRAEIGQINSIDYFHNIVARGHPFTKVVVKDTDSLEGKKVTQDVVETYVPIMCNNEFAGAVEIYYDITQEKASLDKTVFYATMALISLAITSLVVLSIAVFIANRNAARRRIAEEALQEAKQAAEDANKAKDQFLANVSHEIRTPLNAIIGFSEGIIEADSIETARDRALTVIEQSEHLLVLINELLDHAKITAGKITLEFLSLDTCALIDNAMATVETHAAKKGLKLSRSIAHDVPRHVVSDPTRLRQILINLLGNAIKFTEEGMVEVHVESLDTDQRPRNLKFSVVDTGIGIAKEKHEDIFESFTQADGSTTRKYGGTGLGTAICKKIVEMMGGEIGVESEQGKGSTFWFTVPYEISEAPSDNEQAAEDSELGNNQSKAMRGARILVAEDYEPNQEVVRMHLGNEGHTIEIAPNGKIAVEMCIKNKYDLVLMDVQMPELDGIDATKLIRSGGSLSHDVPVIGLTASTSIDTRRACLEAGMNDIIHKPIRRKHLLSMTNKWLSRSSEDASAGDDQPQTANADNPLDFELAVEEFGGKKEVVVDVICKFIDQAQAQIQGLKDALEKQDCETLRTEAHRIRGGAANLTALPLARAAENLEEIAGSNLIDQAHEKVEELEQEFVRLKNFVCNLKLQGKG